MRFLRRTLVGLFLLALTLALAAQAGRMVWSATMARINAEPRSFEAREQAVPVDVVTWRSDRLNPVLTVYGEVQARRRIALRAPVGGIVTDTGPALIEGGAARRGEMLAQIDPAEAQAALARARADLSDAEAETRDAARAVLLARDELAAAETQAALRRGALTRQRDLQTRRIATAADLEAAELATSAADQAVLAAREAISLSEARVDQAATALSRMRIALDDAERLLDQTRITAAFDGLLADVSATAGTRVASNEQIAELIDPTRLELAFRVSTTQYARLIAETGALPEAPVTATLQVAGEDLAANGRISRESAAVGDGQTGRLIFAELDPAPFLRPGDFVTVAITEPPLDDVALLPATALGADNSVLVVEGDRLRVAPVTLLRRQGDAVILRADGLAGAQVVTERTPLLGAGIKVRIAGAPEPDETAMIPLEEDRRQRLRDFVSADDRMPAAARDRMLAQLEAPLVPADLVARLEDRMGS